MKNLYCLCLLLLPLWADAAESRETHRARWLESLRYETGRAVAPDTHDFAEDLVDELRYRSLAEMEEAGLRRGKVSRQPWSDFYWPIYAGGIANRYADPDYGAGLDWQENERFILARLGRGPTERLSPAEKYDLLMGHYGFPLAREMLAEGRHYFERDGAVEGWMGYCDGWAPASFMVDRPARAVRANASDGTEILFYPADIKALASLLWAKGRYELRFIGGRCESRDPEKDSGGRATDPYCLDTNPGTWHLAVVNQLGVARRPLILDTSYDLEVWNQPALAYLYSFVDKEGNAVEALAGALRPLTPEDHARAPRAPAATQLVRVAMNLEYMLERSPTPELEDSPAKDVFGSVLYEYELELDAEGKIVGGEWLDPFHPDFLWVPKPGTQAVSVGDQVLRRRGDRSEWKNGSPVPKAWREAAFAASSLGQPLAAAVNRLVEMAQ